MLQGLCIPVFLSIKMLQGSCVPVILSAVILRGYCIQVFFIGNCAAGIVYSRVFFCDNDAAKDCVSQSNGAVRDYIS